MIQSLVLTAPHTLQVANRSPRALRTTEVRLHVEAAGICGSDIHGFAGLNDRRPVGVVMGHETIGQVIECGSDADLEIGTRVAVNPIVSCGNCSLCTAQHDNLCVHRRLYGCCLEFEGGLATEMVVQAGNCVPVDAEANILGLALIEPMAVGTHAVRLARVRPGATALVMGGGPIGLAVALACIDTGGTVDVCEPRTGRRKLADKMGIRTCTPADLETPRPKYDLAFECVGNQESMRSAVISVLPGSTVICLGLAEEITKVPAAELVVQERCILGSSAYTSEDFAHTARWVSTNSDRFASLVEHTANLHEMPQVFAGYQTGRLTAMKTVYLS